MHTDAPGRALEVGTRVGVIDRVEIANMHEQTLRREERLLEAVPDAPPAVTAVVAVVAGGGNRRLLQSLGATEVIEGGQTMNPAAAELVTAIDGAEADEVVVLPNNANVILSAEQAAALATKPAQVVATDSIPAGIAAMVAFSPDRSAAENAAEMREILADVATGEVTVASRDVEMIGLAVREGDWLGLAGGKAIAGGGDFAQVACAVA